MWRKFLILLALTFSLSVTEYASNINDLIKRIKDAQGTEKIRLYDSLISFYVQNGNDSVFYYINQAINYSKKINDDTTLYTYYYLLTDLISDPHVVSKYYDSAIAVAQRLQIDSLIGDAFQGKATTLFRMGLFDKAVLYYNESLKHFKTPLKKAEVYNSLGICYKKQAQYDEAIKYYQLALKLLQKYHSNPQNIAYTLNSIAQIHLAQKDYETALDYFKKILEVTKDIPDEITRMNLEALTYLNMAKVLNFLNRDEQAIEYIEKSKKYLLTLRNPALVYAYRNAGQIYISLGHYDKAIQNLDSCITLSGNKLSLLSSAYELMSEAYLGMAKENNDITAYHKAIEYAQKALEYIKQTKTVYLENKAYAVLYKSYAALGDYKNAFKYALDYIRTNEIIFNDEKTKVVQEMEAKYQAKEKQQEIEKQKLIIDKQMAEMKRQRMQRNALIAIVVLITAMAFVTYRSYQQKKRDNLIIQQKNKELEQAYEEIRVQRDQLQEQKNKIEKMHEQLQDSIRYAKRIQTAAMPSDEQLATMFDEYFIFFRPLNIVSGDFYWAKKIRNRYIAFTVADCTGHGVPGAFVSMLGISLLNEIVQRREITKASDILEEMRKEIKISLKQSTNFEDSKDGMDIAFCVYDTQEHILQFAGANNPLYLVRNGELIEYKAVKNPVAVYIREKPFETHYIEVQPGDIVYLSSDGFYDQPGGPEGKKFMRKRFKQMLLNMWNLPAPEQKLVVEKTFEEWKNGYKQIDDVCVMGVRFNF